MKLTKGQILSLGKKIGVDFAEVPLSEFLLGIKKEIKAGNLLDAAKEAQAHLKGNSLYYTQQVNRNSENWTYIPPEVYVKRLPQLDTGKLKAYTVDGNFVLNYIFQDYTQGGNPERYKFVPEGQIWIDNVLDHEEQSHTMKHEASEYNDMLSGMSYSDAHDKANLKEGILRHGTINVGKQYDLARDFYRPAQIKRNEIQRNEITRSGIPLNKIAHKRIKHQRQYHTSLAKT